MLANLRLATGFFNSSVLSGTSSFQYSLSLIAEFLVVTAALEFLSQNIYNKVTLVIT